MTSSLSTATATADGRERNLTTCRQNPPKTRGGSCRVPPPQPPSRSGRSSRTRGAGRTAPSARSLRPPARSVRSGSSNPGLGRIKTTKPNKNKTAAAAAARRAGSSINSESSHQITAAVIYQVPGTRYIPHVSQYLVLRIYIRGEEEFGILLLYDGTGCRKTSIIHKTLKRFQSCGENKRAAALSTINQGVCLFVATAAVYIVHCCSLLCVCSLHIKPFFLLNDISTPSVQADSSS